MKSTPSDGSHLSDALDGGVACEEPWTGVLGIETNRDVTFCPCYLQLRIGNLDDRSLREIWNGPQMVEIRESFRDGVLPAACVGQLCPPVLGATAAQVGR